jgi:RNA recognition motif-containing protein
MNLFVAKLNSESTSEDLQKLFAHYGEVSSVRVILDKETGHSKRYGFVEMPNETEAREALKELNETKFQESIIVVKESQPRENQAVNHGQPNFDHRHESRTGNSINRGNYNRGNQARRSYGHEMKSQGKSPQRLYDNRN